HVLDPGAAAGPDPLSDLAVLLDDQDGGARLAEHACGGEASRSAADDHDLVMLLVHPTSHDYVPWRHRSRRIIRTTMTRAESSPSSRGRAPSLGSASHRRTGSRARAVRPLPSARAGDPPR